MSLLLPTRRLIVSFVRVDCVTNKWPSNVSHAVCMIPKGVVCVPVFVVHVGDTAVTKKHTTVAHLRMVVPTVVMTSTCT